MTGLIVAIQFLTRLPMPRFAVSDDAFAASMRWFPAVGLIIGAIVAAATIAGAAIDPWTGALLGLLAWTGIIGALHLDGLGDVADAAGAGHKDPATRRAVLADPHIGSFGVVAIGLQLAAKLVLLHGLIETQAYLAILLVPFAARMGPLVWTRWLPSLHAGLGARFRDAVRPVDLAIWGVLLIAAVPLAPGLAAAALLIAAWGLWLRSRLGGISGDGHGAGIELVESGLLFATLLATRLT
ncbi:adenosylcobinamide-GDP ribazoletransferase [Sphingomonas sp. RS6]